MRKMAARNCWSGQACVQPCGAAIWMRGAPRWQEFETDYAQPLWRALRAGKIAQLQVDILGGEHVRRLLLTRADAWAFWRRAKSLFQ